jgi:CubicO group peptidase (beta-lactamase class C family)
MTENIFVPLGLDDSYFYVPVEKSARLPEVYRMVDGELQLDRAYGEDFPRSTYFNGGGGVRSAPGDILKFSRLFLDGGSVDDTRILNEETVTLMMSDQLGDKAPERWKQKGRSWGFGAAVEYSRKDIEAGLPGKYGWVGGGFAKLWIDPQERLIAYIGFPLTPPGDYALLVDFEERVYDAMSKKERASRLSIIAACDDVARLNSKPYCLRYFLLPGSFNHLAPVIIFLLPIWTLVVCVWINLF